MARDVRAARFKALKDIYPKTAELVERAEQTTNATDRARLEQESVEAYCSENAGVWPEILFKAWQHLNPISFGWLKWLYTWSNRQVKRPARVNPVDYELAFNWAYKQYFSLTAEELAKVIVQASGQQMSADAVKKRRERLGLLTRRPPGPRPRPMQ